MGCVTPVLMAQSGIVADEPILGKLCRMNSLSFSDVRYLRAAEGWLELGSPLAADAELDNIPPALRSHPDVLDIRFRIYRKAAKWDACLEIAQSIVKQAPDRASGWLHFAYSLRRVEGGSLQSAWDVLSPIAEKFPSVWGIPYNMSCYASMLGKFDEALHRFKKATAIDAHAVKKIAPHGPDLKPLWDSMTTKAQNE